MSRRLLGVFSALLLAVVPAAAVGQNGDEAAPDRIQETKDRLSQDRMIELVAGPMAIVETGGLPAGKAAFERLLAAARARHGARSLELADLYTAFGVGLFGFSSDLDDRPFRAEAIPYLEAAVAAYRDAVGNADPELAVALNTYADAQLALHPDAPPAGAEPALDEAYRIRLNALGPAHAETLASLRYLARLRGNPALTGGDRTRIEAVAGLFRRLIANTRNDPQLGYESTPNARIAFARMYAQNHMPAEALEQLRLVVEETRSWPGMDRCVFIAAQADEVAKLLDGEGPGEGAAPPGLGAIAACFMGEDEPEPERPNTHAKRCDRRVAMIFDEGRGASPR